MFASELGHKLMCFTNLIRGVDERQGESREDRGGVAEDRGRNRKIHQGGSMFGL